MNRRLALTVASTSAIVAITAGAAVAANLGILSASPSSGVGQLDATRVAELAVATPASIDAVQVSVPVGAAPEVGQPQAPTAGQGTPAVGSAAQVSNPVTLSSPAAPSASSQIPETRSVESGYEDGYEDESEYEEIEGSLDDHVQDDSVDMDSPHTVETVVVSESDS